MSPFRTLSLPDCPLLQDDLEANDLLEQANQLALQFNQLATSELRAVLDREEGVKLRKRFSDVQDRLTRSHYRVGFLGTSSAGKSTIFNLVLQEKIAESGAGDATTSLPSRLRYQPGAKTCELAYMTQAKAEERLKKLFLGIGFGTVPESAEEQLSLIKDLRPTPEGVAPGQPVIRSDDLSYLRAFIRSRQNFKHVLGNPLKAVPFDQRSNYINHSDQRSPDAASESLLLLEARLTIQNNNLPERLELCDLPGLNSKRTVDNIITQDFLNELDGALLFVNVADNLMNAVLVDIIGNLSHRYGDDLHGRAWVVFNKCDSLTDSHYFPESGRRSVFDNIRELLTKSKVPLTQVCFTSRRLIDASKESPLDTGRAAGLLGLSVEKSTPGTLPAEMRPIWAELLRDGGVSRLREIMLQEVALSVSVQIRLTAREEIVRIQRLLTQLAEAEKKRRSGGSALKSKASECRRSLFHLRESLNARVVTMPFLVKWRDSLREKLARIYCPNSESLEMYRRLPTARLVQQFTFDAEELERTLRETLLNDMIGEVYGYIAQRLQTLPPVPVGPHNSVQEAWETFSSEDASDTILDIIGFPGFASKELLDGVDDPRSFQHFDGEIYLDLLGEKVRVAVGQVIHGVRSQLRLRLGELETHLDRLLVPDPPSA